MSERSLAWRAGKDVLVRPSRGVTSVLIECNDEGPFSIAFYHGRGLIDVINPIPDLARPLMYVPPDTVTRGRS